MHTFEVNLNVIIKLWGGIVPTRHLLPPNEASGNRSGLHLIKLWPKGDPWEPRKNSGYCQGDWLLSTNLQ